MKCNYYSVPADFKKETIDAYYRLNNTYSDSKVIETYGQVTIGTGFESGRFPKVLPKVDMLELERYIEYSREHDIDFNYTFNSLYMKNMEFTSEGVKNIKSFLFDIHRVGVRVLTVAMPSLIELIQSTGLDFRIKASTLCQITSANKAEEYKKRGIERIVLDESVNRDFRTIRNIIEVYGDKVEIIANSLCHQECVYRMFHYLHTCGTYVQKLDGAENDFFVHRCTLKILKNLNHLMRLSWVRPEDIKYYNEIGLHYFKLQGREYVATGDPVRTVEAYFKGDYDGNLVDLMNLFSSLYKFKFKVDNKKLDGFIKPFVQVEEFCKHYCSECHHCDNYAKKAIDYDSAADMVKLADTFFTDMNEYGEYVKSIDIDECTAATCDFDI